MLETSRDVSYKSGREGERWFWGGGLRGVISGSLFLTGFVRRQGGILKLPWVGCKSTRAPGRTA